MGLNSSPSFPFFVGEGGEEEEEEEELGVYFYIATLGCIPRLVGFTPTNFGQAHFSRVAHHQFHGPNAAYIYICVLYLS